MHENSLCAFDQIEDERSTREDLIYKVLMEAARPMTDREIVKAIGFVDMNAARPRVTSLRDNRWLIETGSVECPVTGKRVRRVRALTPEEREQLIAHQRSAWASKLPKVVVQQELSLC
jgi:hypothetical protein